jgi:biopolymer transport protein ExbD
MPKLEPMQQPPSRSGGRRARVMRVSTSLAEINVVPLVDVMLVLLVIFMVAAPMLQQGFAVQLPKSTQARPIGEPVTVTVPASFRTDRTVRVGTEPVKLEFLEERIRQALSGQLQQNVIIAGDGRTTLQELMTIGDQLIKGGVKGIAIQTQPGASGR